MALGASRALISVAGACLIAAAAGPRPQPPGKTVLQISDVGFYSEPSVAIDERDPRKALAAYQIGPRIVYTNDGGRTWHREGPLEKRYLVSGDVSVAYARNRAYVCYIAYNALGRDYYWAHGATRNAIYVRRSDDGGKGWNPSAAAVIVKTGHPKRFEDKPFLVADDTSSRYAGNLYVGWTEFGIADSRILFSRSTDGGRHFSAPIRISTHDGTPRDDNGAVEGFEGAVDADGTLYAVWQDGSHVIFTSSSDGGRTFAQSVPILSMPSANFPLYGFLWRGANGFPQLDVDRRTHAIYVTWSDTRYGSADVFLVSSHDRGRTWGRPVRVDDDALYGGWDAFYGWMAVDHATGQIYVLFYDRRSDPNDYATTVTLARSTNGGHSFTNYVWTSQPFSSYWQWLGDYNGIAAFRGRVYGAWTEAKSPPWSRARKMTISQLFAPSTYLRLGEASF